MKRLTIITALAAGCCLLHPEVSRAQSVAQCLEQLALDYQKLSGLKQILGQLYTSYGVLVKGYNAVKGASEGNFDLHKAFLDGLLAVSPAVRQYPRSKALIRQESLLLSEYHAAWNNVRQGGHFSPDELMHISWVYSKLISGSLKALSDLAMVLSDNQLRMSDAERLAAIDGIFTDSRSRLDFLDSFNEQNYRLERLRSLEDSDWKTLKTLYGKQ